MSQPFPIAVFCYNRPDHLSRTIAALQQNREAEASEVWFFSDGPAGDKDRALVGAVRKVLESVQGFKKIRIVENGHNQGLAASIVNGVSAVLAENSACIVLEDDLETSPFFLDFLNRGLSMYADDQDVFSVSGYCPPVAIPDGYRAEAFRFPRINSWGWGTWRDRWNRVDWDVKDFDSFISNKNAVKKLNYQGKDLPVMLLKQQTGKIGSWAVRFNQACFKEGRTNIYPVKSLVRNVGADGTGTHMKSSGKYLSQLSEKILQPKPAYENPEISKAFRDFYRPSFYRQIINKIKIARYLQRIR
ncbi:glycosyltransferase [Marinilabilia sp.]|uniref:glycosyltransferase n=1 Tax=Marinilabilia sp. TaxID=2021252 RepID=UPI0025C36BC9|nr:glycosyltransferase [Marinilabilia sp.]